MAVYCAARRDIGSSRRESGATLATVSPLVEFAARIGMTVKTGPP